MDIKKIDFFAVTFAISLPPKNGIALIISPKNAGSANTNISSIFINKELRL